MTSAAFEPIYEQYKNRVYNTVLSYVQQAQDAEEVTQDVFMEVFRSVEQFRGEADVGTWIYRIAVNKSLDFLRHKNRQKRFAFFTNLFRPETEELVHDPPDFEHPGVLLEKKEAAATLFKALDTLPESQKTAFILTQVEDLTYAETANVMTVTVASVEALLHRAKQNLRKKLSKTIRV
jgi:RNA polymerase sigma factor (sigma-70 family)